MKRIFLGAVAALPLVLLPTGVASANGGGGSSTRVTIQSRAQYDFAGSMIQIGLNVRCTGASGVLYVKATQDPPETPYPTAVGFGPQEVVCDGRMHSVAVTDDGVGFDAGKAYATATLTVIGGQGTTAARWITIVAA